ncbi:MAG: thiamine pyrophosphate-dependent enzyme [Candidatus Omnitrophota bacterium]
MKKVFERPASLRAVPTHYCSGCGHSIVHRLICEVIDELGIREDVIAVCPVGCAVIAYEYWDFDCSEAPHGRTPCVATGIKRVHPDKVVFSYQGDGDLAAIGTAEIIHTANRGENITVFFINNGVYGMTNGQMAPTTLIGQKTSTSIHGRDIARDGYPMKMSELLSQLPGAKYIERVSVDNPANVLKTKAAIKKALKHQMEGKGFSLVEILSPCPTYWGLSPKDACRRIEDEMSKVFPLGVIKDA